MFMMALQLLGVARWQLFTKQMVAAGGPAKALVGFYRIVCLRKKSPTQRPSPSTHLGRMFMRAIVKTRSFCSYAALSFVRSFEDGSFEQECDLQLEQETHDLL